MKLLLALGLKEGDTVRISDFEFEYNKSLLGQKVEKDFWETCILTNAFYDPQKNSIYICIKYMC